MKSVMYARKYVNLLFFNVITNCYSHWKIYEIACFKIQVFHLRKNIQICYFTNKTNDTFTGKTVKLLLLKSKCYSQTCSNNHLYKKTTHLRWPTLSPTKQIPTESLLYKTTTCLTQLATTFFVSQMKTNMSQTTTTKFFPVKKINVSLIIFTLLLLYNAKFVWCL